MLSEYVRLTLATLQDGDPKPKIASNTPAKTPSGGSTGMGIGLYALILIGGATAFGAYQYFQSQENKA